MSGRLEASSPSSVTVYFGATGGWGAGTGALVSGAGVATTGGVLTTGEFLASGCAGASLAGFLGSSLASALSKPLTGFSELPGSAADLSKPLPALGDSLVGLWELESAPGVRATPSTTATRKRTVRTTIFSSLPM